MKSALLQYFFQSILLATTVVSLIALHFLFKDTQLAVNSSESDTPATL